MNSYESYLVCSKYAYSGIVTKPNYFFLTSTGIFKKDVGLNFIFYTL